MRVELPDVNFDIAVEYPDETGIQSWRVTVSLGGIPLITRSYKGDYDALREYRERYNDEPHWYATDSDHAKEKCITELGKSLRDALRAGSQFHPIG